MRLYDLKVILGRFLCSDTSATRKWKTGALYRPPVVGQVLRLSFENTLKITKGIRIEKWLEIYLHNRNIGRED